MIPIKNVYYMLSYAFKILNKQGYKKVATENLKILQTFVRRY